MEEADHVKDFIRCCELDLSDTEVTSDKGTTKLNNVTAAERMTMSNATKEALLKILFQKCAFCRRYLKVCRTWRFLSKILQSWASVFAEKALDGPIEELQTVLTQVAKNVLGIYISRSLTENPNYDGFRNFFIDPFCGKKPGAKVKRCEFENAAKIVL